jgi:hypothetical protein
MMKQFLKIPYLLTIIGVAVGALGGFLYWNFVGCSSGTCAITSVWYNSTAYGALMGGLLVNSFGKDKKKEEKSQ